MRRAAGIAVCALLLASCSRESRETISHGRFEEVVVVRATKQVASVALLLTDATGWNADADKLASALAREGALVIGIALPKFYEELEKNSGGCEFTDGDLENLSHFVQAYYKLPGYAPPILVGYGEGAAFAYANFAQAPAGTFSGVVTAGLQPRLQLKQELCAGEKLVVHKADVGFEMQVPAAAHADWARLDAGLDGIATAFKKISDAHPAPSGSLPHEVADLPLIELPAPGRKAGQPIAVFWSGDGGWAGLDEEVAAALVARGISVIGVDSLRYFWSERTPKKLAADIDRIVRLYASKWNSERVLLIGFSQGADVLPFAVNLLSADVRARIPLFVPMSLARHATYEFHLSNWVSAVKDGYDTLPEVQKIHGMRVVCIFGTDDEDSVCPELKGKGAEVVELPGSHHFDGDYERLAEEILKAAGGFSSSEP